jgi:hypothetical protein
MLPSEGGLGKSEPAIDIPSIARNKIGRLLRVCTALKQNAHTSPRREGYVAPVRVFRAQYITHDVVGGAGSLAQLTDALCMASS